MDDIKPKLDMSVNTGIETQLPADFHLGVHRNSELKLEADAPEVSVAFELASPQRELEVDAPEVSVTFELACLQQELEVDAPGFKS
jgi:hypothetical protein